MLSATLTATPIATLSTTLSATLSTKQQGPSFLEPGAFREASLFSEGKG